MRIKLSTLIFFLLLTTVGLGFLTFGDGLSSLDKKFDEWTGPSSEGSYSWIGSITERIYPQDATSDNDAIFRSVLKTDYYRLSYDGGGTITPIGTHYSGIGWDFWR